MSDYLTEKDWKDELKQHKDVKDPGIAEPLREFEKNREKDFAKALAALKKLVTKVEAAKKEFKKNADLCKFLSSMAGEARDEQEALEKKIEEADAGEGPDKELNKALKRARSEPVFFAVVAKSATAGKLLMGRGKVPGTAVADAKKAIGGGQELRGLCIGEGSTHVFYFRNDPPATMAQLLKLLAKDDAGLTIHVECRTKADLQDGGEAEDKKSATGAPPSSASSRPGDSAANPATSGSAPTQQSATTAADVDAAQVKACEAASAQWTQARTAADTSMKALRTALWNSNDQQALAVAKGLGCVLGELPDLGSKLASLLSAAKEGQAAYQVAASDTKNVISACVAYLSKSPLVADVEANPFVKVDLKKSLGMVLAETTKSCKL